MTGRSEMPKTLALVGQAVADHICGHRGRIRLQCQQVCWLWWLRQAVGNVDFQYRDSLAQMARSEARPAYVSLQVAHHCVWGVGFAVRRSRPADMAVGAARGGGPQDICLSTHAGRRCRSCGVSCCEFVGHISRHYCCDIHHPRPHTSPDHAVPVFALHHRLSLDRRRSRWESACLLRRCYGVDYGLHHWYARRFRSRRIVLWSLACLSSL